MRRFLLAVCTIVLLAGAAVSMPSLRGRVAAIVRPEPPAPITPIAVAQPSAPLATATIAPTSTPTDVPTDAAITLTQTADPTAEPATATPAATPTAAPVVVNGRTYDAYIYAATKPNQFYHYSCEFDAAWVILETYGIQASGDELIGSVVHDTSVEPYIEETENGFVIHGGNINSAYSGDYKKNFLARSTATAIQPLFAKYGLETTLVRDRAGVEAALKAGSLVWMKTTVDFKAWRPATWVMPDGSTHQTVLGNDHAVVVIGYNAAGVVIRDVLGPTSSNAQRPYEYEVDWATFMQVWEAQSFDGLAVAQPRA